MHNTRGNEYSTDFSPGTSKDKPCPFDIWNVQTFLKKIGVDKFKPGPKPRCNETFWKFGLDEMAGTDLAAVIDKVLEWTNHTQLDYLGHSMGGTQYLVRDTFFPDSAGHPEHGLRLADPPVGEARVQRQDQDGAPAVPGGLPGPHLVRVRPGVLLGHRDRGDLPDVLRDEQLLAPQCRGPDQPGADHFPQQGALVHRQHDRAVPQAGPHPGGRPLPAGPVRPCGPCPMFRIVIIDPKFRFPGLGSRCT